MIRRHSGVAAKPQSVENVLSCCSGRVDVKYSLLDMAEALRGRQGIIG